MVVEFTARQVEVSKAMKDGASEGVDRIALVLGKVTSAMFRFWAERHLQIVELTLQSKHHDIVAKGESASQETALREALAHAEHQAHRYRDKTRAAKRAPKVAPAAEARGQAGKRAKTGRVAAVAAAAAEAEGVKASSNGHKPAVARAPGKQTKAAITVHSFPGNAAVVEPHILSAAEALAIAPMTIEEAVKEAEFRDRDLLIFRNLKGDLFVLHRRRDGKMELAEIPS